MKASTNIVGGNINFVESLSDQSEVGYFNGLYQY